jgi:hypothetical protein
VIGALAGDRDGVVYMTTGRGLLVLRPDGTIRRLVRFGDESDAESFATDGRRLAAARLPDPALQEHQLDVLPNGNLLLSLPSRGPHARIVLLARRPEARLAVALPAGNRRSLRRGVVTIRSTLSARARVVVSRRGRTIDVATTRLRPGITRVALRAPRSAEPHVLKVTARSGRRVAMHRLAVVPTLRLSRRVMLAAIRDIGTVNGEMPVGCRAPHTAILPLPSAVGRDVEAQVLRCRLDVHAATGRPGRVPAIPRSRPGQAGDAHRAGLTADAAPRRAAHTARRLAAHPRRNDEGRA